NEQFNPVFKLLLQRPCLGDIRRKHGLQVVRREWRLFGIKVLLTQPWAVLGQSIGGKPKLAGSFNDLSKWAFGVLAACATVPTVTTEPDHVSSVGRRLGRLKGLCCTTRSVAPPCHALGHRPGVRATR